MDVSRTGVVVEAVVAVVARLLLLVVVEVVELDVDVRLKYIC